MTCKVIKLPKPPEPVDGFPGCVYCPKCWLAWGREDMRRCPHCRSEACDDCVANGWCCEKMEER